VALWGERRRWVARGLTAFLQTQPRLNGAVRRKLVAALVKVRKVGAALWGERKRWLASGFTTFLRSAATSVPVAVALEVSWHYRLMSRNQGVALATFF
jgi:hypothetical protein